MPSSAKTKRPSTPSSSSKPKIDPLVPVDKSKSPLDDGIGYQINRQVNLAQLTAEISQAAEVERVNLALTQDSELDTVLWITPAGIDAGLLAQVLADHEPDPTWGIPTVIQDFTKVMVKLRDDPDGHLTAGEQTALLKGLALNFTALITRSG
jgi:hypothetical protein